MKQQLQAYIQSLFRGAALTIQNAELKEEIMQNTLEHFDDLLAEGKSEQEAYDLAVSGIGDVSQLIEREQTLDDLMHAAPPAPQAPGVCEMLDEDHAPEAEKREPKRTQEAPAADDAPKMYGVVSKAASASMISALWMLVTVAYFLLSFRTGAWHVTWIIFIVGASINCMISAWLAAQKKGFWASRGGVQGAMWTLMTAAYFLISFMTGAWHVTWLVFLIAVAFGAIINAVYDLEKEK